MDSTAINSSAESRVGKIVYFAPHMHPSGRHCKNHLDSSVNTKRSLHFQPTVVRLLDPFKDKDVINKRHVKQGQKVRCEGCT